MLKQINCPLWYRSQMYQCYIYFDTAKYWTWFQNITRYYTIFCRVQNILITQVLIHWLMTPTVQCTNSQHSVNNDCMPQWEQLLTTYLPPSPFPIFPKLCNILNTAPSTHKSPYPSIVSKINVMRSRAIHILIFSW